MASRRSRKGRDCGRTLILQYRPRNERSSSSVIWDSDYCQGFLVLLPSVVLRAGEHIKTSLLRLSLHIYSSLTYKECSWCPRRLEQVGEGFFCIQRYPDTLHLMMEKGGLPMDVFYDCM